MVSSSGSLQASTTCPAKGVAVNPPGWTGVVARVTVTVPASGTASAWAPVSRKAWRMAAVPPRTPPVTVTV